MLSTSNFEEFRRNPHVILAVLNDLHPSFTRVIFRPCITVQVVPLITSMACAYQEADQKYEI